jgi:hypothetical protein
MANILFNGKPHIFGNVHIFLRPLHPVLHSPLAEGADEVLVVVEVLFVVEMVMFVGFGSDVFVVIVVCVSVLGLYVDVDLLVDNEEGVCVVVVVDVGVIVLLRVVVVTPGQSSRSILISSRAMSP